MTDVKGSSQSILSMDEASARAFLLEHHSYCRIDLPPYFKFEPILIDIAKIIGTTPISDIKSWKPQDHDKVNHLITDNKDGTYAWRPMEIIHPVLYVSLVNRITQNENWSEIKTRFAQFREDPQINCHSIPVKSLSDEKNQAEQVTLWWKEFEQRSLELSLEYDHVILTDISNCYGSIYTHSIAWAIHTKPRAKTKKFDDALVGNEIDWYTRAMRNGQTNGIPQGSVLFDFVAEMVLGYSDQLLSERIKESNIPGYQILRYRDDYRIFTNGTQTGEKILKLLTETLSELGLRLHSSKTILSAKVVSSAIKADKLSWSKKKKTDRNLLTYLLLIHGHSEEFPNSGSLVKALGKFLQRIIARKDKDIGNVRPMIGVAVDIAIRNPRTYPSIAAILSHLIARLDSDEQLSMLTKVQGRFNKTPNTGYMDIWMQRFTYFIKDDIEYLQHLCQMVMDHPVTLWESDWISKPLLKAAIDSAKVIDRDKLNGLAPLIQMDEIDLYLQNEWY